MISKLGMEDCCFSTVTVGERGQIVIPAETRKKMNIHAGEKLFIMSHPSGEGLMLFRVDAMREFLNHLAESLSIVEGPKAGSAKAASASKISRDTEP